MSVDGGGHLLKVVDGVVGRRHCTRLVLDISDGRLEWRRARRQARRQFIDSKFLFMLQRRRAAAAARGEDAAGAAAGTLYVALNRVVAGDFRSGSGLCRAVVSLFADPGQ